MSGDPLLDFDGASAPPRLNGELVFTEPWQTRIFGATAALCERGAIRWSDVQRALIAEIAGWERANPSGAGYAYWERWRAALEALLAERGLVSRSELDLRSEALSARPEGHDHRTAG